MTNDEQQVRNFIERGMGHYRDVLEVFDRIIADNEKVMLGTARAHNQMWNYSDKAKQAENEETKSCQCGKYVGSFTNARIAPGREELDDEERKYTIFDPNGPILLTETELCNGYMEARTRVTDLEGRVGRQAGTMSEQQAVEQTLRQDVSELKSALREARESLIDHACKLPLSKRDHGPVLYVIDAALERGEA